MVPKKYRSYQVPEEKAEDSKNTMNSCDDSVNNESILSTTNNGPRIVYFQFATSILSALVWINSLVCTIFIVIGLMEWCNSIENNGNVESCREAEKWDWTLYTPAGINGSKSYTYLFMAEIASICSVLLWFIIVILSGRNFKRGLLNARAAEYYLSEERMHYMYPTPTVIHEIPVYEVKSEGGSRFL